jgi:predicted phosphodiesterase
VLRFVGVIGDVHAEELRLARVLDFFASRGVDRVLQVGDFVDGLGSDADCVRRLRDADALVVRGNHERWLLEALPTLGGTSRRLDDAQLAWTAELPSTRALDTAAGSALLCHGLGEDDMTLLLPRHGPRDLAANVALGTLLARGERLVLAGHTHVRMVRRIEELVVINAGTLYRRDRSSCTLVDFTARHAEHWDVHEDRAPTFASSHRF